jgi:hypothetical protein
MATEYSFRFNFIGTQARAIGNPSKVYYTYKAPSLGHALFMLFSDYDIIRELNTFDTTDQRSMFDSFEETRIPRDVVRNTELKKHKHPRRETSPNTGTYKYYRSDAPDNYKW